MVRIIKVSGQARNNGVDFFGDCYKVSCTLNKDQSVTIKNEKRKIIGKVTSFLMNVPILRTIAFFIDMPLLFAIMVMMILSDVLFKSDNEASLLSDNIYLLIFVGLFILTVCSVIFLIKTILWKLKKSWQFHGAEHKTIYAVGNDVPLELVNVRKCPRISECCGTNFVVFFVFFATIFFTIGNYISFLDYFSVKSILSFIIAYELFCINNGDKRPIVKYFHRVGFWLQQNLFTIEPTDAQLQAAISAMHVLVGLETTEGEAI